MRILTGILAAGLIAGASSAAMADGLVGPYVGLSAGVNFTSDSDIDFYDHGRRIDLSSSPDSDLGYALSLQGGYAFGGPRLEAEVTWRSNDIDKFKLRDTKGHLNGGGIDSIALMGNAYYDIPTGSPWTPYVGAGIGVANVRFDSGEYHRGSQSESLFAYQGIVGLAYNIDQNISIKADYRYFATLDPRFDYGDSIAKTSYNNHTIMLGFSYTFGAAPAAVVAPVKAQGQNFLVFFDFDKSLITHEGARVVRQAADAAKAGKPTRIEAIGHTDTVGSAAYNMALSKRRAEAVKAELIKNGVPGHIIEVIGRGKTDLLVPTGDNVREPQNRRVQIIL